MLIIQVKLNGFIEVLFANYSGYSQQQFKILFRNAVLNISVIFELYASVQQQC